MKLFKTASFDAVQISTVWEETKGLCDCTRLEPKIFAIKLFMPGYIAGPPSTQGGFSKSAQARHTDFWLESYSSSKTTFRHNPILRAKS